MREEDLEFFKNIGFDIDGGFGAKYNLFAISEGILIAETLQTKDMIITFSKSSWDDQKSLVPLISNDHSGNTFDMACHLAILYLPQLTVNKRDTKIDGIIN